MQIFPTYLGCSPYYELTVRLKKKKVVKGKKRPDKTGRNFLKKTDCNGVPRVSGG